MEKMLNRFEFEYKIVLIDDNNDDREAFSTAIKDLHYQVVKFSSGAAALNYLKQLKRSEHPSVIVTDYQLPGMNGSEILSAIKHHPVLYHIPVVLYSSVMNIFLQEKLKRGGAAACFVKSPELGDLVQFLVILGIVFENSVFHSRA